MVVLGRERAVLWHLRVLSHNTQKKTISKREGIKQRLKMEQATKSKLWVWKKVSSVGVYKGRVKEFRFKQEGLRH